MQSIPRGITALNLTASVTQSGERAGPRRFRLTTPGTEDLGVERVAPKSEGRRAGRRPRDENPQDEARKTRSRIFCCWCLEPSIASDECYARRVKARCKVADMHAWEHCETQHTHAQGNQVRSYIVRQYEH